MYQGMLNLSARASKEFSEITMCDELLRTGRYSDVGKRPGVEKFFTYSNVGNPVILGGIVLDLHSRRLEIGMGDMIHARAFDRSMGEDNDNDMAGRMAAIQAGLQEIQKLFFDDERSLPSSEFASYYDRLMNRRISTLGEPKMNFKWGDLNQFSPSFVDGDLIIMVAESGAGKSSLMADQAEYLWERGYHGIYYHLELTTDKMADRRIARRTGLPMRVLQDGREAGGSYTYLTNQETGQVRAAIGDMTRWPGSLTLKHCPGWTMHQICADMRIRASNGPLDFIVLDYFNKVRTVPVRGSYLTHDLGSDVELLKVTLDGQAEQEKGGVSVGGKRQRFRRA
jgi:replicative DNA helicase